MKNIIKQAIEKVNFLCHSILSLIITCSLKDNSVFAAEALPLLVLALLIATPKICFCFSFDDFSTYRDGNNVVCFIFSESLTTVSLYARKTDSK